ncbi:hypothetical protein P692DRAFT_20934321 [Suillus brevipes Sb2]|nr:hypothetical protein P692DRAFT_20934321 [Suillus brevipes Sb2]
MEECPSFKTCFVQIVNFQCCHRLTAMLRALCFSILSLSQSTPGPLPLTVSICLSSMHHQSVQYHDGHHTLLTSGELSLYPKLCEH